MTKSIFFASAVFAALCFFVQVAPGNAGGNAGTPTDQVRATLEKVMSIQTDPQLKGPQFRNEKRTSIKQVISRDFHFDGMAKEALGRHWQELSDPRRLEFKALFQDLFQESYTKLVLDFLGREKILYTREEIKQGRALVKTTIVRVNEEIPVDYFLRLADQKWLVEDVAIDGVSIVQNYQKSFSRVIRQESYDGLLRKMRLQQQTIEKTS